MTNLSQQGSPKSQNVRLFKLSKHHKSLFWVFLMTEHKISNNHQSTKKKMVEKMKSKILKKYFCFFLLTNSQECWSKKRASLLPIFNWSWLLLWWIEFAVVAMSFAVTSETKLKLEVIWAESLLFAEIISDKAVLIVVKDDSFTQIMLVLIPVEFLGWSSWYCRVVVAFMGR